MEICRVNLKKSLPHGVTMVELAIALGILTLLLFLAVPSFTILRRNVALSNSSRELQSALRLVQTRALAAQGGVAAYHGIQLQTDRYVILNNGLQQEIFLPKGITISGAAVGQTIIFTRLSGLPSSPQEIVLSAGGSQLIVQVEAGGLINLP